MATDGNDCHLALPVEGRMIGLCLTASMLVKPTHPPSASGLGRFLRLSGTGMRIAGNVLWQRLTPGKSEIDWQPVADLLGDVLGQMKGPVLKLGQQASQWHGILPVPISKALERLQNRVPAMPFSALEEHLQQSYDGKLHQLFRPFEPVPAAAASLGQVHRARDRQGQALVVKVQYPGIAAICAADLRQVRRLMPLGRLLGSPASQLEAVYAELKRSIHQELDYETEQDSVQRFHDHFAGWPNLQLPRAIGPLCRPGILVMEDVPGRPMAEAEQAPAAVRQQLALTLTEWFLEQSFGLGLLHADPHPGNLAWTDDGRLVVYDFGSVLEVEPSLLKAYLALFEALRGPDSAALEPAFQALGGRRRGSSPPFELYERIHRIMHPLLQPGAIWDFRASALHQQLIALLPQVMAAIGSLQPASGTLLVNRTLEGHYWTLYRLGARLPVHDLLMQHIERHFAQGPDDHGGLSA